MTCLIAIMVVSVLLAAGAFQEGSATAAIFWMLCAIAIAVALVAIAPSPS